MKITGTSSSIRFEYDGCIVEGRTEREVSGFAVYKSSLRMNGKQIVDTELLDLEHRVEDYVKDNELYIEFI